MSNKLTITFLSSLGTPLVSLSLFGEGEMTSLHENGRYEYELDSPRYRLKERRGIIRRSRIDHEKERGSIEPGNYVGLLQLELLDKDSGKTVSKTQVDVRSTKLNYEGD